MDQLDFAIKVGTMISVIIGVLGLALGIRTYRRQTNAQLFLEYTRRYEEIMGDIPPESLQIRFEFEMKEPGESARLKLAILRYLNMTSEELYLWKRGYLADDVWQIWAKEVRRILRSPLLRREWPDLKVEFEAYEDFCAFVERIQGTEEAS